MTKSKAGMFPLRTCLGCRKVRLQKELIRICSNERNELELDLEKKKQGRGAYLCPSQECWDKGLKKERLEYTLKIKIAPEALKLLQQAGLPFVH